MSNTNHRVQLHVYCNLFYATKAKSSYMCHMQLIYRCILQLLKPNFILMLLNTILGLTELDSMKSFRECCLFFKYTFTCALNSWKDKSYLTYSQLSSNLFFIEFIKTRGWALILSMIGSKTPQYPCNMFIQIFYVGGFWFLG
jgi:hypothetical protein